MSHVRRKLSGKLTFVIEELILILKEIGSWRDKVSDPLFYADSNGTSDAQFFWSGVTT
jgi:hypothetical protein